MASLAALPTISEVCKKVANDPTRKGILVALQDDHTKQLLQPTPGLPPRVIHRCGLRVLVWWPDVDFAACLPGGVITCPCCKKHRLTVHERFTRNVRRVMARDRTIFMLGCTYRCTSCQATKAAEKAAGNTSQRERIRAMREGDVRSTWVSWDSEVLKVLPAEVQQAFPVVLNSGTALHKPLFNDLMTEVAAGRRSFSDWACSLQQHQHQLYYEGLQQWLSYRLRCTAKLLHPALRSSSDGGRDTAVPADQGPHQGPAAAAAAPPAANPAAASKAAGRDPVAGALTSSKGRSSAAAKGKPPAGNINGKPAASGKLKQTTLVGLCRPRPPAPMILGSSSSIADGGGGTPGVAGAAAGPLAPCGSAAASGSSTPVAAPAAAPSAAAAAAPSAAGAGGSSSTAATLAASPPVAAPGEAEADGSSSAAATLAATLAPRGAGAGGSSSAAVAAGSSAAAAAVPSIGQHSNKRKSDVLAGDMAGFGTFDDIEGWAGYVASPTSLIALFIEHSKAAVAAATFRQLHVGGDMWKGDHSYKFTKCVRKGGEMVYAAVFTIMNELNQVVSQYLTEDSSWEALVGNMASTRQRLEREQLPTAKTMYLDCTVTGEGAIRAALPGVEHVMEDPFHVMRRITDFIPDDVVEKPAMIGMVSRSLLPVCDKDVTNLRLYCTKPGCHMGLTVQKDGKEVPRPPMYKPADYNNLPPHFQQKYCRRYTPAPAEQERRLRDMVDMYSYIKDPRCPGQLLWREGGPLVKALEQVITLVRAGKLQDPLPVDLMYHNTFSEVPGRLTVPRSKRGTSQLEGYHGAALNHVLQGHNTSTELAIPQLTLTNHAWNLGRQVVAGKMPQYHCHDLVLLQSISNKLQRLGSAPLEGVGEDLLPFMAQGQLDVDALTRAMNDMCLVQVTSGVLPDTQKNAEELDAELPEGEDDVLAAAVWLKQQAGQPQAAAAAAAAANGPPLAPVPPWLDSTQLVSSSAATPGAADAAVGAIPGGLAAAVGNSRSGMQQPAASPVEGAAAVPHAALPGATASTQPVTVKVGGHALATLDVAVATGTGTAILGKRSHASRRGATYAEQVQPVHGQREWDVFRRLLKDCTTRRGTDFQKLGDLWDAEMEQDPEHLTPKSTITLKAAEREYSNYLALRRSTFALQESMPDTAPALRGGSTDAAVGGGVAAVITGAGGMASLQVQGMRQPVAIGQELQAAQGQQVLPASAWAAQQLAVARALSGQAVLTGVPAANQAALLLLQQQPQQQVFMQQQAQLQARAQQQQQQQQQQVFMQQQAQLQAGAQQQQQQQQVFMQQQAQLHARAQQQVLQQQAQLLLLQQQQQRQRQQPPM